MLLGSLVLLCTVGSGGERRWSRRGGMLVLAGHVPSFYVSWLPKESGPWEAQPEIGGQEEGRIQNISPLLPCLWLGLCSGCNSSSWTPLPRATITPFPPLCLQPMSGNGFLLLLKFNYLAIPCSNAQILSHLCNHRFLY